MKAVRFLVVLPLAAALSVACNRPDPAADPAVAESAAEQQMREREAADLEARLDRLEQEWEQTRQRVERETSETTTSLRQAVEDDIAEARRAVADLDTTTVENWWERQEQQLERAADEVEQDVRRFARRFTEPELSDEVPTTGEASEWRARRDRLIANMEARIRAMEEALEDVDPNRGPAAEVEDTRERVREMREDTQRLRNASEADWWQVTKDRAEDYLDRLEAAIDRLAEGRG